MKISQRKSGLMFPQKPLKSAQKHVFFVRTSLHAQSALDGRELVERLKGEEHVGHLQLRVVDDLSADHLSDEEAYLRHLHVLHRAAQECLQLRAVHAHHVVHRLAEGVGVYTI